MKSASSDGWKRTLAIVLLAGAAITWGPELVSAPQAEKPAPRPDAPANGVPARFAAPAGASARCATPAEIGARAALGGETRDLAESLEQALAGARRVLPERPPLDIEALARSWSRDVGQLREDPSPSAGDRSWKP